MYLKPCVLVVLLAGLNPAGLVSGSCDKLFQDKQDDAAHHTRRHFEAPIQAAPNSYAAHYNRSSGRLALSSRPPASDSFRHPAMHCLYKFVARPGRRVILNFKSSRMRGSEPDCISEYVDIYVKLKSDESIEEAIGSGGLMPTGRFCTASVPHKLVSLYNMIVLSIYSDREPRRNLSMFSGSFEFVDADQVLAAAPQSANEQQAIGPPDDGTLCSHTIRSSDKREGEFQTLTYPGVYAKGIQCAYKFLGESPLERVRLEFLDLDLYSGGGHCPFDTIRVFDGANETAPLIQLICGSHRSLIIYSTHEHLLVTFTALQRGSEVRNRGYSAYFEFSDKFVQPSFIQGPNARHIRGTECDQRIVSSRGSRGFIVSPEIRPSNHVNATCRYFFEGLQSAHDYEKVLLRFVEFDLKASPQSSKSSGSSSAASARQQQVAQATPISFTMSNSPMNLLVQALAANATGGGGGGQAQSNSNLIVGDSAQSQPPITNQTDVCPDNYVRLYTDEQKPDQRQDPNEYDYVFCGNELPSTAIESDAASLLIEFNSGTLGGHFKAEYVFIVDFRISGYQITQQACNYVYHSDQLRSGTFNSPRHPLWYIDDMNCTFAFLTKADEALLLQFNTFQMAKSFASNLTGYNEVCQNEDSIEINEITLESPGTNAMDTKRSERYEIGTYCGLTTPGPILSYRPVLINFRTNKNQVDYGFSASFHFHPVAELRSNEFVSNCGEQIHTSQRNRSGIFSSPPTYRSETYEKRNHICVWNITARPNFRIALNFTRFELEGSPAVRGCATAAVRLETDKSKRAAELCGTLTSPSESHQFVSHDEHLSVTFISTKQASGSNGFTAVWQEIKRTTII